MLQRLPGRLLDCKADRQIVEILPSSDWRQQEPTYSLPKVSIAAVGNGFFGSAEYYSSIACGGHFMAFCHHSTVFS
jgi:hypothetical protein